jgi:hypothetical protein
VSAASQGEAHFTTTEPSNSAALDFRIVIPPVMRVLENSHSWQLNAGADRGLIAAQRVVVLSNIKHGFCVTLSLAMPGFDQWLVDVVPEPGVTAQAVASGKRLCSARPRALHAASAAPLHTNHNLERSGAGRGLAGPYQHLGNLNPTFICMCCGRAL